MLRRAWIQIEVTTRCNCACVYCPRTVYREELHDRHLPSATFKRWLPTFVGAELIFLQGWDEPLIHPCFPEAPCRDCPKLRIGSDPEENTHRGWC